MQLAHELVSELSERIDGTVCVDDMTRQLYSTDASIYRATPIAVVFPRHADDVAATVQFAADNGLPILPRGGGTSLEGQTVNEAVVIDCSRHLNQILELNAEEGWARVQPGVVQDALRRAAAPYGLDFGPDTATATRATLGGMIGNNSAGAHSIVHGKTIDHVLDLRCLLADGSEITCTPLDAAGLQGKQRVDGLEGRLYRTVAAVVERHADAIRERFPKVMRRVTGYNLDAFVDRMSNASSNSPRAFDSIGGFDSFNMAELMVGSEATLAVFLDAKVRLVRLPSATALGVAQFDDLVTAMEATRLIVETQPSAVELIDDLMIRQARAHSGLAHLCDYVEGSPKALLITEYSGESPAFVADQVDKLRDLLARERLGFGFYRATGTQQQADVWQLRKAGLALMLSLKGDAKPIAFVEDTAVPVDRLPEYVARLQDVVDRHDTWAGFYGHASVGCLHFRPVINLKEAGDVGKLRSIAEEVRDLVVEFDGALAGEHGDGRTRTEYLPGFFGQEVYSAFRQIKTAFDPEGRMNPGNICDPLSMSDRNGGADGIGVSARRPAQTPPRYLIDTDLRYGVDYHTPLLATQLDWTPEGSFSGAVEMCNGNGACRKTEGGTMCPSYMVTRSEEHSTRGRANALRAVIAGQLPSASLTSERLYQVMDLCLECKACKSECPSGVDMAKLKYEFLAQYQDAHGVPLRARLFANADRVGRWGSRLAPISNWMGASPPGRWLNERLLGVSARRHLPTFVRRTFEQRFGERRRAAAGNTPGDRGRVVLFHDTFMNYNVPTVGLAAVRVLEAAGFEVVLAKAACCGRPMLSNGLVGAAAAAARANVAALMPHVEAGTPIVGCEPSCLLMLRDDYRDLLGESSAVRKVAEASFMIDEFLVSRARGAESELELQLGLQPRPGRLLVHGHCHQKALIGMEPTMEMLRWIPELEPVALDTGCCGMAGSFGYKAEHYDTSMAIGELSLFPALRNEPGAGVAVSGISCRHQVQQALGGSPRHPIEWLADALPD